jgi:hypothetical protein
MLLHVLQQFDNLLLKSLSPHFEHRKELSAKNPNRLKYPPTLKRNFYFLIAVQQFLKPLSPPPQKKNPELARSLSTFLTLHFAPRYFYFLQIFNVQRIL